jgi:colicin import membrane protein
VETFGDKLRAFALAVGVHLICAVLLVVGLSWTRSARSVSVPGPIIEATLVGYAPPRPVVQRAKPQPPKPQPVKQEVAKPRLQPEPPRPPRAEDLVEQERVDRNALEPLDRAQKEQEEKRKKEQVDLTEMEKQRLQQIEDVRRLRQEAEKKRIAEAEKLATIERQNRQKRLEAEKEAMRRMLEQEAAEQAAGTEGQDDSLLARYVFAIQKAVEANWLRPDTAAPGLRCKLAITQIPGGEVIEAHVTGPCNADELTRRSIEAAVMKAQPLPYTGYESVFTRTIEFNFSYDG